MQETIHLDGVDIPLTKDSITALLAGRPREVEELKGWCHGFGARKC